MLTPLNTSIDDTRGDGDPPPVDEEPLVGPPSTAWRDFKQAKLRQFLPSEQPVHWLGYLGHGEEGIVYKATFGTSKLVRAVKVYWRTRRPEPRKLPNDNGFQPSEWPFEEECLTHAILEKIKWAMKFAEQDPEQTILIKKGPGTFRDAIRNFYAFSDEGRRPRSTSRTGTPPPPFPALPECYGWTRIRRDELPELNPPVWRKMDEDLDWHWATVNELVPRAEQDIVVGGAHLQFFHDVGIALEPYKADNWHGGRLLDCNDICTPFSRLWHWSWVRPRIAETWFEPRGQEPKQRRHIVHRKQREIEDQREAIS